MEEEKADETKEKKMQGKKEREERWEERKIRVKKKMRS